MRPAESILDHLEAVREALARANGPKGAWQHLCVACPDLAGALPFNTFMTVAPVVLATAERLHGDCATSPQPGSTVPTVTPKTFEGWSMQTDGKNYIRAHRKIGGVLPGSQREPGGAVSGSVPLPVAAVGRVPERRGTGPGHPAEPGRPRLLANPSRRAVLHPARPSRQ